LVSYFVKADWDVIAITWKVLYPMKRQSEGVLTSL